MTIRIGTRGSKLARWQAEWVASQLSDQGQEVTLVFLQTTGDVRSGPIATVGGEGLFTKEIQRALLENDVDLAVHSLKDLPTDTHEDLQLASVPPREACGDALLSREGISLTELPPGARIGTGSARRRAQLLAFRADLQVVDVRGNVDTRLEKLARGDFEAIILAEAGLRRLGLDDQITEVLSKEILLPAVGQGALGLEIRADDTVTHQAVATLNHEATQRAVVAERALLRSLRGGCLAPVGAWGRLEGIELLLDAVVLDGEGQHRVTTTVSGPAENAEELGILAAEQLLAQGAQALLEQARDANGA